MSRFRHLATVFAVVWLAAHPCAAADVVLTNGKTLQVEECVREGAVLRMTFPGGGEMTLPLAQVRDIRPSEPQPDPRADLPPAPAPVPTAPPADQPDPAAFSTGPETGSSVNPGVDIDAVIDALATRHGVSPRLVRAVIEAESGWNPRAVSRKGAAGLMQLMPGTARGHGVTDPFDPEQNLDAGVAELGAHLRQYEGELSLALAAYNAGGRSVARYGGIPPYRETLRYVRQVLDRYFTAGDLPRLGDGAR